MNKFSKMAASVLAALLALTSLAGCAPVQGENNADITPTPAVTSDVQEEQPDEAAALTPGVYTASAQGNNGPVTVEVECSETAILSVTVTDSSETKGIGTVAAEQLTKDIVAAQSTDVDNISSATLTCTAIKLAVNDCIEQAGGKEALTPVELPDDTVYYQDGTADMVVVGAGAAGLSAAIKGGELGLNVVLLEKMDLIGGTSVMAGVGINAGGSSIQMESETPYTAEMFYEYLSSIGVGVDEKGKTTVPLREDYARAFADNSASMIEWLLGLGMPLKATANHSVQMSTTEDGLFGEVLIEKLTGEVEGLDNVDVRTGNKAVEIVMEDGKVAGVKVEQADGSTYVIQTSYAVLCTGGYGSGTDILEEYAPEWLGYPSTEAISATGDGLKLALAAGGAVSAVDAITYRTLAIGHDDMGGAVGAQNAPKAGAVLVNAAGERFVNELASNEELMQAVKAQEGDACYIILTQEMLDANAEMTQIKNKNALIQADTLEELAEKLGVDSTVLAETAAAYNQAVASGTDEAFGRETLTYSLEEGPYYGAKAKPSKHICTGGITINGNAEVLDAQDQPVTGLYAAGETTNHGNHPVSAAIVFGRIAAEQIFEKVSN